MAEDSGWGGIAQGVGSAIGAGLEFLGQERTNRQNKDIWKKTQDWTEHMSNTQWQRGVADMKAAGINPMVAFSQGGASSPSGTIGSPMRSPTAGMSHSATAAGRAVAEVLNLRKQNEKLSADTDLSRAQTKVAQEQKKLVANSAKKVATDTTATEGTVSHALGTLWNALKPSSIAKIFEGAPHSAKSLSRKSGSFNLRDFHD